MILVLLSFGDPFLVNTFRKRRWLASASSSGTAAVGLGRIWTELSQNREKLLKSTKILWLITMLLCKIAAIWRSSIFMGSSHQKLSGFDSGWFLARATSCLAQPHRCVMRWSQSSGDPQDFRTHVTRISVPWEVLEAWPEWPWWPQIYHGGPWLRFQPSKIYLELYIAVVTLAYIYVSIIKIWLLRIIALVTFSIY